MAKFAHADVLDGGLLAIKNNADKQYLISAYAVADSFATVTANKLAEVAMVPGDYTISSSGNNRVLTTASGKSGNASAGAAAGSNLHFAFVDTANSKVLWVTDETTDQAITSGNPVDFPPLSYTGNQPT